MKNILLGIFKRWICFIPALIFVFIGTVVNAVLMNIPYGVYWILTGRNIIEDSLEFIDWTLS